MKNSGLLVKIVIFVIIVAIGFGIYSCVNGCGCSSNSSGSGYSSKDKDSYGHDKFDAITIAEKEVKAQLKAPSTAKFCRSSEYTVSRSSNTWTVSGWVDAQNSFGATLRNNFTVKITFSSSTKYTASCSIR